MKTLKRLSLVSLVVLLAGVNGVPLFSHGRGAEPPKPSHPRPPVRPAIVEYHLVRIVRVSQKFNDLVFRATLKNGDTALAGATAQASSPTHGSTIIDGSLTFGPVRAHGFVESRDTFTVRHHKWKPFHLKWLNLRWTITPNNGGNTNRPPVANAGPDQNVGAGASVRLDGSASSDPDGNSLNFQWTLTGPVGSTAALSSATAMNPTFTPDKRGAYQARLVVDDGTLASPADSVTITVNNAVPVANAGADITTFVTQTATLDGTASRDGDGDPLTFAWSFVSRPAGSGATLSDPAASQPTFLVDRPGSYVVRLIVNDGTANSAADTVTVTTQNRQPTADAGPDQTGVVGTIVTLNGGGSSDPDGNALNYAWAFQSRPAGSGAVLGNPTSVNPTFGIDAPGTYVVRLTVNDGSLSSVADTVAISTVNSAPVANAGPDQTALVTQLVTLDGSASSDVDGNALTFAWSFVSRPSGSGAVLTGATTVGPNFVVDRPGTYRVRLIVNDGSVNSVADTVDITTQNSAPVAHAGPDQSALVTATVTLDGSGSTDVDGDTLSYVWALTSRPSGSTAALSNPSAVMPTFVVDRPGSYVAQLIVNDGFGPSAADTVTVTTRNSPPVANAGPDQSAVAGRTVALDGIGSSDVDGNVLTFDWAFTVRPSGSTAALANANSSAPTFVADRPGTYVVQLIVNDGTVDSAPDTISVSTTNTAPVANAGPDQSGLFVGSMALDGSGSTDADNHAIAYQWSLLSAPAGSTAVLNGATLVNPTFSADRPGDYVAQLIVSDGFVDSAPDTVLVRVDNRPPTADAGLDQGVPAGTTVLLSGSGSSDPDGQALTYAWVLTRPGGSAATLTGATTVSPSFVPDVAGTYTVDLTVTDASGATDTDSVVVTAVVPPTVTVDATDANASESGSDAGTFTFTRTGPTSAPLTVTYNVGGTAANGGDYAVLSGSVTIQAGQSSATVAVTPVDDSSPEASESVIVTLSASADYVVGAPAQATVAIADNEPTTVTIVATDATASETGPDTGTFTIFRSGDTSAALNVNFWGPFGSAAPGTDYSGISGSSVTIAAGQSAATVTVTPVPDSLVEGSETIELSLIGGSGYVVGVPNSATITIGD